MLSRKSFGSDNHAGVHPAVLSALATANAGDAVAYGDDPLTEGVAARLRGEFRAEGGAYFVFTGTAANVLGLSLMLRPYQGAICADVAHLNVDECGAVERILGNKLLPVPAPDGKLTPDIIAERLAGRTDEHRVQPGAVAITQVTEWGTCYTLDELHRLGEFCRARGLRLYLDGARLANAAAHLGCSLADLAEPVDVLSFGGTKNGAAGVEAVIVMDPDLAAAVPFLRKQQMQLSSKMRYLAAQFGALLDGDLWLDNARHANAMARRLADGVKGIPGVQLHAAVESNAVFASLSTAGLDYLQRDWEFHVWDEAQQIVRWMTAFDTTMATVDEFTDSVRVAATL